MIIAFSGIDGSGKTTHVDFLRDYFKQQNLKCKYRHMVKDSFYNFILHNFIGRFSKSSQRSLEDGLRNRKNKIYFFALGNIKKILLLVNLIYFNLRYWKYKDNIKNNIVCDRYFYDDIVQIIYLKLSSDFFIRFYKNLIIEPDITFFLKVNPQTAYLRKNEYKNDYFLDKCLIYEEFYNLLPPVSRLGANLEDNKRLIINEIQRHSELKQGEKRIK